MKFYESPAFKELEKVWREKLKQSKFPDIEDSKERLKNPDNRTIAYENQDKIRDFFLSIDSFIAHYPDMPKFERKVMELYSRGIFIRSIVKQLRSSDKHVRNVIKRYKGLIMAVNRLYAHTEFPLSLNPQSDAGSKAMDANHQTEDQAA